MPASEQKRIGPLAFFLRGVLLALVPLAIGALFAAISSGLGCHFSESSIGDCRVAGVDLGFIGRFAAFGLLTVFVAPAVLLACAVTSLCMRIGNLLERHASDSRLKTLGYLLGGWRMALAVMLMAALVLVLFKRHQTPSLQLPAFSTPEDVVRRNVAGRAEGAVSGTRLDPVDLRASAGAATGPDHRGSVWLEGYALQLPEGRWTTLASHPVDMPTAKGTAYFLGRIEHGRLIGGMRVSILQSGERRGGGFPTFSGCRGDDPGRLHLTNEALEPFGRQACWWIRRQDTVSWKGWADPNVAMPEVERAAVRKMNETGVEYPQNLIAVGLGRADRSRLLEALYLFDPEAEKRASSPASSRASDGDLMTRRFEAWGDAVWPLFTASFDHAPASSQRMAERPEAGADLRPLEIRIGDSVSTVQKLLDTDLEPQPMAGGPGLAIRARTGYPPVPVGLQDKTFLHIASAGLWVFFDREGKVYTVRFDAPFRGAINGIRLGDDLAEMTAALGPPSAPPYTSIGTTLAYRYPLDAGRYVIYDVAGDGKVRYILITRAG